MDNEALHTGKAVFSLDIHPAYSNRVKEGVYLQLQSRLMRWDEELGGVLLAFSKLQRMPSEVDIRPYFAYLKVDVKAEVLIFKPKVGHVLCGQVNKMGADYIGMTILGAINGAIGRQNMRKELQYDHQAAIWRCSDNSDGDISEGSNVLFAVDKLRIESGGILAVMGSLKETWAGAVQVAAKKAAAAFPDASKWQTGGSVDFTFPAVQASRHLQESFQRQPSASILEPLSAKKEEKKRKRESVTSTVVELNATSQQLNLASVAQKDALPSSQAAKKSKLDRTDANIDSDASQGQRHARGENRKGLDQVQQRLDEIQLNEAKPKKKQKRDGLSDETKEGASHSVAGPNAVEQGDRLESRPLKSSSGEKSKKRKKKAKQKNSEDLGVSEALGGAAETRHILNGTVTPDVSIGEEIKPSPVKKAKKPRK